MADLNFDDRWIECVDDKGRRVEMPFRRYLKLQERRIREADQALGIERDRIPAIFRELPDVPAAKDFMRLQTAISQIPCGFPVTFSSREARHWLRCTQYFWEARAIALAYKLYPLPMPDPLADGELIQTELIPRVAYDKLLLIVKSDICFFDLLTATESNIRRKLSRDGHPYAFTSIEDLFLQILKTEFEICITNTMIVPEPILEVRKNHRNHHRQWIKFLNQHYLPEEASRYEEVLRRMGVKGYVFSVLMTLQENKSVQKLWKRWIKSQRPFADFIDHTIFWVNEVPYQSDISKSGSRIKHRFQLSSSISKNGYIDWAQRDG